MWAPKFAFDWHERIEDGDETAARPHVTANAMLRGALAVGVLSLVIFVCAPGIDVACARLFYIGNHHFIGNAIEFVPLIRLSFNIFFFAVCAITLVGLIMAARKSGPWLDLSFGRWLFVALCLITGPLVVANLGFKDHWGRARPRDVIEFGGSKAFSAPFPPSTQCDYNCSFVSGEASSIFVVLFAAALLFKSRSRNFVALGVVLGGLAGLMRMAQGGHFLSDVIFAGVLMCATAASIWIVFETLEAEHLTSVKQGPA